MDGPPAIIQTDPAPGFKVLVNDKSLHQHRITLELGHAKNPNKNPVAERAIQALIPYLSHSNSRLHLAHPLPRTVVPRDVDLKRPVQCSDTPRWQLPNSHPTRTVSCQPSVQWALQGPPETTQAIPLIDVGDLVYLHSDRNKSRAQDRYLLVSVDPLFCNIKKFVWSQLRSSSYRVKLSECYGAQLPHLTPQLPLDAIPKTLLMKMTYSRSRTLHCPHLTFLSKIKTMYWETVSQHGFKSRIYFDLN